MDYRPISQIVATTETTEGHGARVRRSIGSSGARSLPPFVVCEQYALSGQGRPPHPCRGLQKISLGLKGTTVIDYAPENMIDLHPGDVTSVMVGRGVIRSTHPGRDGATTSGIHIWLDVPEKYKRVDPKDVVVRCSDVVKVQPTDNVDVAVLSGRAFGAAANQDLTITPAVILKVDVRPGGHFKFDVPESWNAFVFMLSGDAVAAGSKVSTGDYIEYPTNYLHQVLKNYHATHEASEASETSETSETSQASASSSGSGGSSETTDTTLSPTPTSPESAGENNAQTPHPEDRTERTHIISIQNTARKSQDNLVEFVLCAALPLNQPIYQQGPFVDVSPSWVRQAYLDYSQHTNGFEDHQRWNDHSSSSSRGFKRPEPETRVSFGDTDDS